LNSISGNYCFACGEDNPRGLRLEFVWEEDKFVTYFTPEKYHEGYPGIVHGGITAALLDEIMGKSMLSIGCPVMTAELKVRYKKPLRVGQEYRVVGWIVERKSRVIFTQSVIQDVEGNVVAEGEGKMIVLKEEDNDVE